MHNIALGGSSKAHMTYLQLPSTSENLATTRWGHNHEVSTLSSIQQSWTFNVKDVRKEAKITKYTPESSSFSRSGVSDIGTYPCDKSYHCPTEGHRNTGKQEVCWIQIRYRTQKSIYCIHKTKSCNDKWK